MEAECIISGIRPEIAQTIVHLGLDLTVPSKATMVEAFAAALRRVGKAVLHTCQTDSVISGDARGHRPRPRRSGAR
jgi:rsbT co-antagonist protein RsbR